MEVVCISKLAILILHYFVSIYFVLKKNCISSSSYLSEYLKDPSKLDYYIARGKQNAREPRY